MALADKKLDTIQEARVLVVGDIMLDRYWFGGVERISPEAPVPIVLVDEVQNRLGGAGNVALNIASLGARCTLIGTVGDDEAGKIVAEIASNASVDHDLVIDASIQTCVKQRVISQNQQLLRADFETRPEASLTKKTSSKAKDVIDQHDIIVLSDYGKGTLENVQSLISLALEHGKPVLVDPKGDDFSKYSNASLITPNLKEFEQVVGPIEGFDDLEQKANSLIAKLGISSLLVTLSERGMNLFQSGKASIHSPAKKQEVYDVSGAGDTVIAVMAMCMATEQDVAQSLRIANNAAGVVVSKIGTATVNIDELREAMEEEERI
ncbi:MAG: D-glycero-beta-D-manno-heptose-7-phosphate kinase [Acidiferrobacterales bacterium]|nr:D-glycero-beta-D-manno-heptose-7-phosphate kinase [Acidiferrobacterales bacterium]